MRGNPLLGFKRDGSEGLKVIETKRGAIESCSDMSLQEQGRANADFMEEKEVGAEHRQEAYPTRVPTSVPPSYLELIQNRVSSGKMVPRDRIELSTPAFSGLCSTN